MFGKWIWYRLNGFIQSKHNLFRVPLVIQFSHRGGNPVNGIQITVYFAFLHRLTGVCEFMTEPVKFRTKKRNQFVVVQHKNGFSESKSMVSCFCSDFPKYWQRWYLRSCCWKQRINHLEHDYVTCIKMLHWSVYHYLLDDVVVALGLTSSRGYTMFIYSKQKIFIFYTWQSKLFTAKSLWTALPDTRA
jgi:hypothetical protein